MNENMLKLLTPLGFLGLLGLIILLIIYILKPNYQQKVVSSSYVWKLSLKYKKRRIPTSRLRNILILICQVLIISISAVILTQPFLVIADDKEDIEKIVIIDASASMLAQDNTYKTRFERAKSKIKELRQVQQGLITVIVAGESAYFLEYDEQEIRRQGPESTTLFNSAIDGLSCTYGDADVDAAMILAERVIDENPAADVIFYTATQCADFGDRLIVEWISDPEEYPEEYNAAILNASAIFNEGYYTFAAEVASYRQNRAELKVYIEVYGANAGDESDEGITVEPQEGLVDDPCIQIARCVDNESDIVYFENLKVTSFDHVRVSIVENDSFLYDNEFLIYGATKEEIKILYHSSLPNVFFNSFIASIGEVLAPYWKIIPKQFRPGEDAEIELVGYDFYIFEHGDMPDELPADGVVLIANPRDLPVDLGITVGGNMIPSIEEYYQFSPGNSVGMHPIMNGITPENIKVWQFTQVTSYDGFEPLMFCGPYDDPVVLVKDEVDEKVVVFAFNLNFADLSMLPEFPILMFNIFNHFMPFTFNSVPAANAPRYVYDVGEKVTLNARGPELTVKIPDINNTTKEFDSFTAELVLDVPGTYRFIQDLMRGGDPCEEHIFVKISTLQSDFSRIQVIKAPFFPPPPSLDWDLLIYLAAALVALLFVERLLQSRDL